MNSEKPQAKAIRLEEMSDAIVVSFEAKWQEKLDSQLVDIVIRKRVPKDRSFRWIYFHINSPVSSICGRARIVRIGNFSSHDILAFSDRIGLTEKEILSYIDGRDEIAFYESRIFLKKRIPDLLKSLYRIKRQVYVVRKVVNLTKEIIEKTVETNTKGSPFSQDLKDFYTKTDTQIEEVYDSIVSLMNIYISVSSQRTNEVMRTLTVFTAFFLPLTFIVGVYGMNFAFMPELQYHWGYPGVIGLMLVITLIVWSWFKRKGWL